MGHDEMHACTRDGADGANEMPNHALQVRDVVALLEHDPLTPAERREYEALAFRPARVTASEESRERLQELFDKHPALTWAEAEWLVSIGRARRIIVSSRIPRPDGHGFRVYLENILPTGPGRAFVHPPVSRLHRSRRTFRRRLHGLAAAALAHRPAPDPDLAA